MKFCQHCGKEIADEAVICPGCGVAVNAGPVSVADPTDAPSTGFAILGFFFPVIGLILYLVWKGTSPLKAKSCGKGALIGVIVEVVLSIISVVLVTILGAGFITTLGTDTYL